MKPQLLLAEGNNTKSPFIILEAKTLRDSKHIGGGGGGWVFGFFPPYFVLFQDFRPMPSLIPVYEAVQVGISLVIKKNERTLLNHTVIFFKAHSSYINIYINIFLFITNTRQALVTQSAFVIKTKTNARRVTAYFHRVVK